VNKTYKSVLTILAVVAVSGCATKATMYQWGSYEEQVYATYSDPGKVSAEEQLAKLESDYEKARSTNKPVPPGYNAYLGYLYFQVGKADQALHAFETEKQIYPESAVYMDRLIARLKKN
jgi:hypothetical protein